MEDVSKIREFLSLRSGSGSGYGYGSGDGYGYGSGFKSINGLAVYYVDGTPTVFYKIKGNVAKGAILRGDMTLEPCWIVKGNNYFAHGETLHKAREALLEKMFEDMPEDERIAAFVEAHKPGVVYPDKDYFDWHHRLTGSCEMGRMAFARDHGLESLEGSRTPEEFIALCENSYGGSVIKKLREYYRIMREFIGLYRGKRKDNGEWVEGYYCTNPEWDRKTCGEHHWIISCKNGIRYEVDPDTVGECTGLRDKNGKLIFEGDIVKAPTGHISEVVYWHDGFCQYCDCHKMHTDGVYADILEIIGNIHDNKELLKGGEQ